MISRGWASAVVPFETVTVNRKSIWHVKSLCHQYRGSLLEQEAFEKCWAHSPLRAAARPNFALPFTRCRYCRTPPLSHAACASMSRTTTTTRDRGDRYDPIEWAQKSIDNLRDPKLQPSASAIQPRLWGENEFVFLAPKITTMSCELSSTRRLDCDRKCQQIGLFFGFQSVLLCFPILFIFRSTREVYSKPEGRMNRCHV